MTLDETGPMTSEDLDLLRFLVDHHLIRGTKERREAFRLLDKMEKEAAAEDRKAARAASAP